MSNTVKTLAPLPYAGRQRQVGKFTPCGANRNEREPLGTKRNNAERNGTKRNQTERFGTIRNVLEPGDFRPNVVHTWQLRSYPACVSLAASCSPALGVRTSPPVLDGLASSTAGVRPCSAHASPCSRRIHLLAPTIFTCKRSSPAALAGGPPIEGQTRTSLRAGALIAPIPSRPALPFCTAR